MLLAGIALTACASSPESPKVVPITELSVGDCFSSDAEVTVAELAPSCEAPHVYEVMSMTPTALGEAFPGDDALAAEADALCSADFAEIGRDALAGLATLHLIPTEDSWAEGDRDIACLIVSSDGAELTGSRLPAKS